MMERDQEERSRLYCVFIYVDISYKFCDLFIYFIMLDTLFSSEADFSNTGARAPTSAELAPENARTYS